MESGQMTAAPQIHTDAKPVAARPPVLNHLDRLEAESIHILREVMAECRNPVMLYSIGKDSSVLLHLLPKAFHPADRKRGVKGKRVAGREDLGVRVIIK